MGVRTTASEEVVAIFGSVTGWAFGPTFATGEEAEDFLVWTAEQGLPDLRSLRDGLIEQAYRQWLEARGRMSA